MKQKAIAGLALLLIATPVRADSIAGTFRLGSTGINCVKAPCPWRGIMKLDANGKPDGRPLWAGNELPTIKAEENVRNRIAATWKASGCLVVEGELDDDGFAVSRIVGDC